MYPASDPKFQSVMHVGNKNLASIRALTLFLTRSRGQPRTILVRSEIGASRKFRLALRATNLLRIAHVQMIEREALSFYSNLDIDIAQFAAELSQQLAVALVDQFGPFIEQALADQSISAADLESSFAIGLENELYKQFRELAVLCKHLELTIETLLNPANVGLTTLKKDEHLFTQAAATARRADVCINLDDLKSLLLNHLTHPYKLKLLETDIGQLLRSKTIFFGTNSRPAYLEAFRNIQSVERECGRETLGFLIGQTVSKTAADGGMDQHRGMISFDISQAPARGVSWSRPRVGIFESGTTIKGYDKLITLPERIFEGISDTRLIRYATKRALDSYFARHFCSSIRFYKIAAKIIRNSNADSLTFCPSRSPYFASLASYGHRHNYETIEYQPFLWSSHPRYTVRNVDWFLTSEPFSENVIREKYKNAGIDTNFMQIGSFGLDAFEDEFVAAYPTLPVGDKIGVALQPEGMQNFISALSVLSLNGLPILIRPHPSQRTNKTLLKELEKFGTLSMDSPLTEFVAQSYLIITGFSNVALEASRVGRPILCLGDNTNLGIDISSDTSGLIKPTSIDRIVKDISRHAETKRSGRPPRRARESWLDFRGRTKLKTNCTDPAQAKQDPPAVIAAHIGCNHGA